VNIAHPPDEHPHFRVVHNLSSSGGTLFSRCLGVQPGVLVASELNPFPIFENPRPYSPFDPHEAVRASFPGFISETDWLEEWTRRILALYELARSRGKTLVLRDHAHTDFLTRGVRAPALTTVLRPYQTLELVLIRHPLDSWLSMRSSKFGTDVETFAQYSDRVAAFLACYESYPLFRYEDIASDPPRWIQHACETLDLPFDSSFEARFSELNLSGNSGRQRASSEIGLPIRRPIPEELSDLLPGNGVYRRLCESLGYHWEPHRPPIASAPRDLLETDGGSFRFAALANHLCRVRRENERRWDQMSGTLAHLLEASTCQVRTLEQELAASRGQPFRKYTKRYRATHRRLTEWKGRRDSILEISRSFREATLGLERTQREAVDATKPNQG